MKNIYLILFALIIVLSSLVNSEARNYDLNTMGGMEEKAQDDFKNKLKSSQSEADIIDAYERYQAEMKRISSTFGQSYTPSVSLEQYLKTYSPKCEQGNCKNGYGIMTYYSGLKYNGQWKDNKYNGYGIMNYPEGLIYAGEWKDNSHEGQGTLTFPDGVKYVGQFKNSKFEGQGNLTYPNGLKYVGQLKNGNFEGQGTLTYANGVVYIGQFKNGEFEGQGTKIFPKGGKYVGEYKNGKEDGQGTLYDPNGKILYKGLYRDGRPVE